MGKIAGEMQAASDDGMEFERPPRACATASAALASIAQETADQPGDRRRGRRLRPARRGRPSLRPGVLCFRAGQNWGNRAYFPKISRVLADKSDEDADVMEAFIGQFYDDKPIPKLILTNIEPAERELLAEAFAFKGGRKVEILTPKRGEKRQLVEHAFTNAREALGRKMAESSAQSKLLAAVCETFGLEGAPERIEVYDNSHVMGTNAVGGMIVAGPDGFQKKSQYRKFNIKGTDITPGDDFGMMKEVLRRRFARLAKEEEEGTLRRPTAAHPPRPRAHRRRHGARSTR